MDLASSAVYAHIRLWPLVRVLSGLHDRVVTRYQVPSITFCLRAQVGYFGVRLRSKPRAKRHIAATSPRDEEMYARSRSPKTTNVRSGLSRSRHSDSGANPNRSRANATRLYNMNRPSDRRGPGLEVTRAAMCVRLVDVRITCGLHDDAQLAAVFIDPRAK